MELTVLERLVLIDILPKQGDYTTLKIVRELREALSFTEEEHEVFGVSTDGDSIKWNPDPSQEREISIGPKAISIISDCLTGLSEEKKLTDVQLPLYEKFIGE